MVLATFECYLAPYTNPQHFWPIALFGLMYPFLLLMHLLFFSFWAFRKNYYLLFSLCSILLGWNHFQSFIGWHFSESCSTENSIRLVTFNGYSFRTPGLETTMKADELPKYFPDLDADILCIQEFARGSRQQDYFNAFLAKKGLRYRYVKAGKGLAVYSRFPIQNAKIHSYINSANGFLIADLMIKQQPVRLFNVHMLSNGVSVTAHRVAKKGNLKETQTWKDIVFMLRNYKNAAQQRVEQAKDLQKLMAESPYPIILCGDFNETPQSYIYQMLSDGMQDAFISSGRGLGTTYAGDIPALHIDHVLMAPTINVCSSWVANSSFSDHYPVVTDFIIEQ